VFKRRREGNAPGVRSNADQCLGDGLWIAAKVIVVEVDEREAPELGRIREELGDLDEARCRQTHHGEVERADVVARARAYECSQQRHHRVVSTLVVL
jgi:hypothetical protein